MVGAAVGFDGLAVVVGRVYFSIQLILLCLIIRMKTTRTCITLFPTLGQVMPPTLNVLRDGVAQRTYVQHAVERTVVEVAEDHGF